MRREEIDTVIDVSLALVVLLENLDCGFGSW